ncbi:MAG: hypothetical protein HDQ91_05085 [Desulfovibrio sp.]|nr:hypothetical protein [Desulfovibrio sp.]
MKIIHIKYNPYHIQTEILIDGKAPKDNSKLHFGKLRIQEWAEELPEILVKECSDREFTIHFVGTLTDFNDLKEAFNSKSDIISVSKWSRDESIPDVSSVEDEVDNIFVEIQKGPVKSLKDTDIVEAFKKAKNQEFEINVVATMSSGKSTLINALLGKKLMPVANTATTATIVRIIDTDQDSFNAVAYDANGNVLYKENNIEYAQMKVWNADKTISAIDIYGRIPCVDSVGMKLILVDTPGPNNSRDKDHERMTYQMLNDSDKSLVLFVMNGTNLSVNDEAAFMDYVCNCMKEGGKQSRERYIFAINKMDAFNPEDDDIPGALRQAKEVLEERGIMFPNIYPISAQVALECRTNPVRHSTLDSFQDALKYFDEMKFDSYYEFNNLPHSSKKEIERLLKEATEEEKAEIHSGIVSVEEAVALYVNKYARALKVKDLVESFNNRLKELAAIESLKEDIRCSEERKVKLNQDIERIRKIISSGDAAKVLSSLIDKKDFTKNVSGEINPFINELGKRIDKIIFSHTKSSKVPKSEALRQVREIQKESSIILTQLDARIDDVLTKAFETLYSDILDMYKEHLKTIGLAIKDVDLNLSPLDFVSEDIANIDSLIKKSTQTIDEGHYVTKTKRESRKVKKTNWFWTPWNWGSERYDTEYYDRQYQEWVAKNVEYVNMSAVATQYLQPIQVQLVEAKKAAEAHAHKEGLRIKDVLKKALGQIDGILDAKLTELQKSTDAAAQTEQEIKRQHEELKWMEGIIAKVNNLINF